MSPSTNGPAGELSFCKWDPPQCYGLCPLVGGLIGIRNTTGDGRTIEVARAELAHLFEQMKAGVTSGFTGTIQIDRTDDGDELFTTADPGNRIAFTTVETDSLIEGVVLNVFASLIAGSATNEVVHASGLVHA